MNIILFDGIYHKNLLPLTYTRPVCELRIGILTIKEKWEHYIENPIQVKTQDYLSKKFGSATEENSIGINGSILPSDDLMSSLLDLKNKKVTEADYREYILKEYTFLKRPVFIVNTAIFIGNSAKVIEALKIELT